MGSLQPGAPPVPTAERLYSTDLLDDFLRQSGKDGADLLDLDGALFGPELWDLTAEHYEPSPTRSLRDGVVPQTSMDRASSSSSSSGSGQGTPPVRPDASTASLLAYYSYPATFSSQQVLPASPLPAPWQMMPLGPPTQAPPPYRPKWQPLPAQVPNTNNNAFGHLPSTQLSIKTEDASDAEDCKLEGKVDTLACVPSAPAHDAECTLGAGYLHGGRLLDRKERVRRYQEKRKRRTFEKTIRYQSRKAYAEVRPRIKGRFATREEVRAMKAAAAAGMPYCPAEDDELDEDDSCDDDIDDDVAE